MTRIITLTTDFGLRDPYVAEMKGVILGIAGPAVQIVDVTHDVQRHDIAEGALALEAVAPFFPAGTIHVAVVDPGVGTSRRGLAVVSSDRIFVGPDNGLCTSFLEGEWRAFELAAPEYRLPAVSRTFHGRDVFAPAAAYLAGGVAPASLGPVVANPVRLAWAEMREVAGDVAGSVVHVDRFGNLITSIRADAVVSTGGAVPRVRVAGRVLRMVGTYGDLRRGEAGVLAGSSGRLEIAAREASAAALLKARRGTTVVVTRRTWPAKTRARRPS